MVKGGRILASGRRSWLRDTLQPAILLYALMIRGVWLALIAMVDLAGHDIFAPYSRLRLMFFAAACTLTALLVIGFLISIRHRIRLAERETLIARQKVHLNSALANMPEGLCMFDSDQRLIVCNQQYADLYPLSKQQAQPGTSCGPFSSITTAIGNVLDDPEAFVARRLSAIAAGKAYQHVNRLRDGRLILVTHRSMDGGGWVATHKDVTEQVNREESFRLLFEGSPVPMWVSDRDSLRFLAVNDAAVARYGYSREQFMAMTVPELRPQADQERFGTFLRSLALSQFTENIGQHITADGTKIDVSVSSRALTYAGRNARLDGDP